MKDIFVTQPSLPPLDEFVKYLEDIWKTKCLTNEGKYHQEFEINLCDYLGVEYNSIFANGTLALMTALQVLRVTGEVITTPYSFVATTHALHWNGIKPIFCDIEPITMNLDPKKIEAAITPQTTAILPVHIAITPQTTAILPVHIYGNPCNVDEIQKIADIYGLKVIYDAAHAFGVEVNGNSILNCGDLSVLSFHATKVITTFEGGAIVCHDEIMKKRIDFLKNFGYSDEITVVGQGINGKMNEVQAAMGLLQLKYIDSAREKSQKIACLYREMMEEVKGIRYLNDFEGVKHNYSYFPIFIDEREYRKSRDEVYEELKANKIFARRYFYPLISQFSAYKGLPSASVSNLPVADRLSNEILCLPIYPDLDHNDVERVINVLRNGQ